MSGYVGQISLIFILMLLNAHAKKPPGYVAPPKEYDPNPPKYEYGYRIQEDKVTQGKDEERDGIYAQGRYYVKNGTESSQNVKYFADDWGYHPVVEYSNIGPHSKSSTSFVLGEEAIKLKNNQKSIPQDPSDPGKAVNLAKLDPSNQRPGSFIDRPLGNNGLPLILPPQLVQRNPSLALQPQLPKQANPTQNPPTADAQQESEVQSSPPSPLHQTNQVTATVSPLSSTIDPGNQQISILLPHQPQLILQSDPQLQILTNQPEQQQFSNREVTVDPNLNPELVLNNYNGGTQQPVFYYIEPKRNVDDLNIFHSSLAKDLPQHNIQQIDKTADQPIHLLHQVQATSQAEHIASQQSEDQQLPQLESLPQPQALVIQNSKEQSINPNNPSAVDAPQDNGITDTRKNEGQALETAALIKIPNEIVEFQNILPQVNLKEFGARLSPKDTQLNHNKLIESTKNLVSGTDVLNINAAQEHSLNDEIETSTLQSLLQRYVTPTIVSNHNIVDVNHIDVTLSTTAVPPVATAQTSLLQEPIIVAESENDDSNSKPVTEKTDESREYFATTARSSLSKGTTTPGKEHTETSSDDILVTPRPVSSKFLAPITAGIQLQHVNEQIFEDSKTGETHEEEQDNVFVQIQSSLPHYLGMYEYPSGYDLSGQNLTGHDLSAQQKAIADIELGKTLLYFPGGESPKAEELHQKQHSEEQSQVSVDVESNQLAGQQSSFESKKEIFSGNQPDLQKDHQNQFEDYQDQQNIGATNEQVQQTFLLTEQLRENVQERPSVYNGLSLTDRKAAYPEPYPNENKIVERPVHVPIEVTKYVDRPYPVEVRVPYPQPYPVEKIVHKVVKEPYPVEVKVPIHVEVPVPHPVPVEKIIERKVPVPYYIEKPVEKIIEKPVERIVERKIPVPYYIEKPVEKIVEKHVPHYIDRPFPVHEPISSQAYLLQIPGLFSQQKYSTLVHNSLQNSKNVRLQYPVLNGLKLNGQSQLQSRGYPVSYASQIHQYLPSQQNIPLNKGHLPRTLKKLNLLVFPSVNIANLPPITRNPHDLLPNAFSQQTYRFSNAQLDNGYLPPVSHQRDNCDHSNHQLEASSSNADAHTVRKPEEHLGLIPPRRPLFEGAHKQRTARAHFDDKSVRMEYGFMPPLVPSLEIDEQGQPIEKDDNKN